MNSKSNLRRYNSWRIKFNVHSMPLQNQVDPMVPSLKLFHFVHYEWRTALASDMWLAFYTTAYSKIPLQFFPSSKE